MKHDPTTSPRFSGIGGHHSPRAGTVEWLTPPRIITTLGPFDLDPCAPIAQPYPTARETFTILDDGLFMPWRGDVWLNPPYENVEIERWLAKMALHNRGCALIFARTETEAFRRHVWNGATALLFMFGRINFHVGEGFSRISYRDGRTVRGKTFNAGDEYDRNAGAPTVLCAYGMKATDRLAECGIEGAFVPRLIPRSVLVSIFPTTNEGEKIDMTWREALGNYFASQAGPVRLEDLYRVFSRHPKATGNRNFDAKLRQQLQRGPYRRVGRGLWEASNVEDRSEV